MSGPTDMYQAINTDRTYALLFVLCLGIGTLGVHYESEETRTSYESMTGQLDTFDLQGHRGARGLLPENTIPGFMRALDLGVTTLEMDIVVSADSQIVVSHEPWFSRTICLKPSGKRIGRWNQKSLRIFDMTYDEITAYDCGSLGHPGFPQQKKMEAHKPLLRDVITAAESYARRRERPEVRYNIETKTQPNWDGKFHPEPRTVVRLLYDVLTEKDIVPRATIQSFDMRTLRIARAMDRSIELSLLIRKRNARSVRANVDSLGFVPDIYSPDHRLVDRDLIAAAHDLGMKVIPWTVNESGEMKALKAMGVDGLITDYPDRGRDLLDEE